MKPLVVFDLDDTLYAERDFVRSGFRAVDVWVRRELGFGGFALVAWEMFLQGRRGRIFDEVLFQLGVDPKAAPIDAMVAVYRAHVPLLDLLPDARRALKSCRDRAWLGLITDGYAEPQRRKIAALDLTSFFDEIICTDELGREFWKPAPLAFEQMMARFKCAGAACVYVGDNPTKDFLAPNRLGWRTVRIQRTESEHACTGVDLPGEYQARDVINSLDELSELLWQPGCLEPSPP